MPISSGCATCRPHWLALSAEPSMTMPLPKVSCAWCTVSPSAYTACFSKPNARHSQSIARSEEHTSELQSLMRISYAVFCLKKKTTIHTQVATSEEHITPLTTQNTNQYTY